MTAIATKPDNGRVTQLRVIRSEWIKFVSLRSNRIAIAGALIAMVLFGWLTAGVATGAIVPDNPFEVEGPDLSTFLDHVAIATAGIQPANLILGALGVLAMAGEYSSGMIRATLAAVPKRSPVLWGKVAVLAAVTIATVGVGVFASFAVTGAMLQEHGLAAALGDENILRALLGNIAFVTGIALIGLSLGVLLRSAAGGITTLFATLLIVPQLLNLILPDNIAEAISGYLPSNAGLSIMVTDPQNSFAGGFVGGELLTPLAGGLVFLGWVALAITAATLMFTKRDA